jgi:hypothetical protein
MPRTARAHYTPKRSTVHVARTRQRNAQVMGISDDPYEFFMDLFRYALAFQLAGAGVRRGPTRLPAHACRAATCSRRLLLLAPRPLAPVVLLVCARACAHARCSCALLLLVRAWLGGMHF